MGFKWHVPFVEDKRHGIVFVDFYSIYKIRSRVHVDFYVNGLIKRMRFFAPDINPIEYCPGVVHITLEDFKRYQVELKKFTQDDDKIQDLILLLNKSIHDCAYRNIRFEKDIKKGEIEPINAIKLLDSVLEMMSFFNLNDELNVISTIDLLLEKIQNSEFILSTILKPYNLSYVDILRFYGYELYLGKCSMEDFIRNAAFLLEFDVDGLIGINDLTIRSWLKKFVRGKSKEDIKKELKKILTQYSMRYKETKKMFRMIDNSLGHNANFLKSMIKLHIFLLNHEEQRHYWQMRSLMNISKMLSCLGMSYMDSGISDIYDRLKGNGPLEGYDCSKF